MGSRLLWRRSATAVGFYASTALGILGTIVAARRLDVSAFGIFATVVASVGFFQALLDVTVEESLTKYGFRYVAGSDWGSLHRLFSRALQLKLVGGLVASLAIAALSPFADALFDTSGLAVPILLAAPLPLAPGAGERRRDGPPPARALRHPLRLRDGGDGVAAGRDRDRAALGRRRRDRRPGRRAGRSRRRRSARSAWPRSAASRGPRHAARCRPARDHLLRRAIHPRHRGRARSARHSCPCSSGSPPGARRPGLLRIAQAPQTGLTAASAPARLILLTEQTRDWEHDREEEVLAGVRRYLRGATLLMVVAVPVFFVLMRPLVEIVFGAKYADAVTAARVILFAGAIQFVVGWSKSLPGLDRTAEITRDRARVRDAHPVAARPRPRRRVRGDRGRDRDARLVGRVRVGLVRPARPAPPRGGGALTWSLGEDSP